MVGVEGGISVGANVCGPSMGTLGGPEVSAPSSVASLGNSAGLTDVAAFDISINNISSVDQVHPLNGFTAYNPAIDVVNVLGPEAKQTYGLAEYDVIAAAENIATNAWNSADIPSAVDSVAKAAWEKSEPYSAIEEANKVVEDAVNTSPVHVMSPFEVMGLLSVGAKAQQALSKESLVEEILPITEVDHPVEFGHEEPMQIESAIEVSPALGLEEVSESVAQQEPTVSFSDVAVAQKVAEIAGESGLQDIATQAEHIVSQQTALIENNPTEQTANAAEAMPVSHLASFSQENIAQEPFSSMALEEVVDIEKKGQTGKPNTFEHEELGPVRDERANGRRREIAADVISQMSGKNADSFSAKKFADEFERRAEEDPRAKSEVVREDDSSIDGTIADIGDDLRKTSFDTPDEANDAISQAILRNPAVAIRERRELPEEALWKVLRGKSSRRYASLAA